LKKIGLWPKKVGTLNAFMSETGKLFANVPERNEGDTIPQAANHCGCAELLRKASKSPDNVTSTPIEYICFRKTSGSNMGAPNLLLA